MRWMLCFIFFVLMSSVYMENVMPGKTEETTDGEQIVKYELNNGLTVILEENHSSPVVAVNTWVKVGSACELEGEYGIAHVHEHMLFKGTKNRGVGEIAKIIESNGGDINAFTSFDETVYFVVIASRFVDTALDVLSDAVGNSLFDQGELDKELEVVLEEIRRGEDSPSRNLSEKLFSTAYEVHPYKRPIIGTSDSVRSFNREKIVNFYKKWYSPENMVLVIVGDFKINEIVPKIEDTFGKLINKETSDCKIHEEPKQNKLKTFIISKDLQEGYFSLAYHIPNATSKDTPVLDVISIILGSGDSSRLYRRIKEEKGLVNNVYSYSFTPKYNGMFVVGGSLNPDKSKDAYIEILKEINNLKTEPVSSSELEKAKINIESDSIYTKETVQGQAQKFGFYEVEAGKHDYEKIYLDAVSKVTLEDIVRISNKYFNNGNLIMGLLLPDSNLAISEKDLEKIASDSKKLTKEAKDNKRKEKQDSPNIVNITLDNGIRLLIKENRAVPLFAARAVFLGGVRFEDESNNGVSNFVSKMFTRGTESRSSEEIAVEIESLAGQIEGFSGRNSFGVTVESLSKYFDHVMEIFSDVVKNPVFDETEIERARMEIISSLNLEADNPVRTTINLFLNTLFREHPYRFNTLGSMETINAIGNKTLKEFYNKYANPENLVIAVVGDVDANKVKSTVEKYFGSLKKENMILPEIVAETPPNEIRDVEFHQKDRSQTNIILGFQAPTLKDDDRYAFEILNTILAGQGGRLFLELRDKKSLAYTVTSFFTLGLEPGFFGVYIGTAPEKEREAIDGIKEQLQLLLDDGITDDELNRAKNYLVGNFEIGLQQNSSQATKIAFDEIYGIGWDEYQRYPDMIYKVRKEDVVELAKKHIDLKKYTIAVVRPDNTDQ